MSDHPHDLLDRHRQDAGLSYGELWLRYFELGGMASSLELQAIVHGALRTNAHDHDVIAHALNERFAELGGDHPVPYAEDRSRTETIAHPATWWGLEDGRAR